MCLPAQQKARGLIVCFVLRTARVCASAKPGLAHFIFLSLLCEIHQLIKVSCGCRRSRPEPPPHTTALTILAVTSKAFS